MIELCIIEKEEWTVHKIGRKIKKCGEGGKNHPTAKNRDAWEDLPIN